MDSNKFETQLKKQREDGLSDTNSNVSRKKAWFDSFIILYIAIGLAGCFVELMHPEYLEYLVRLTRIHKFVLFLLYLAGYWILKIWKNNFKHPMSPKR